MAAEGGARIPVTPTPSTPSNPAPAPVAPAPQPTGGASGAPEPELQRHRVHHSYVWLGTLRAMVAIVFAIAVSMMSSIAGLLVEGGPDMAFGLFIAFGIGIGGFVVVLAVVLLVHYLAYRNIYFTLGPAEFSLYSGIITKKRVHVPYDRVQSIDARASLLQRVCGVRTVYIDTAGGANNKAVVVPYVTKAQAEWLTSELYGRKRQMAGAAAQAASRAAAAAAAPERRAAGNVLDAGREAWDEVGGIFAGGPSAEEAPTFEYGLTNKELFLAGLSNNTSFVVIVLGFIAIVGQAIQFAFDLFPDETDMAIESLASQTQSAWFATGAAFAIAGILCVLAVVWIVSALGQCVSYGGFRAKRVGDRIEVERGLLQHTRQSIGIGRVQAVVVKQSVIRRLIGYCEVSLDKVDANAGDDDSTQKSSLNAGGVIVHPFCKLADVPAIVAGLVPEYAAIPQGRTPLAPAALRRAVIRRAVWQGGGFWLAVVAAVAQVVANALLAPNGMHVGVTVSAEDAEFLGFLNAAFIGLYVLAAVFFVLEVVGAVLWARESGFAVNERFMKIVNGGMAREERSFLRAKIQYGFTKTNPLQRMAHVTTINVRTAAGVGGTSVDVKDVREEDGAAWLAWLEPRRRN